MVPLDAVTVDTLRNKCYFCVVLLLTFISTDGTRRRDLDGVTLNFDFLRLNVLLTALRSSSRFDACIAFLSDVMARFVSEHYAVSRL